MTTSRACKSACSLHRLSAGCRNARSIIQVSTQIEQESSPVYTGSLLRMNRSALGQRAGSSCLRSGASSAAIKSP
jgi:hypothetical protein